MMRLLDVDKCLLEHLARLKFSTREQLSYWCESPAKTVFRRLAALEEAHLVSSDKQNRPFIWTIKNLAAAIMLTTTPAGGRRASWPAMSHACHANEVEIKLNKAPDSKGFHFVDRVTLFKRGLNPGHAEHGGIDDEKKAYLVLVDDYMMKPDHIGHSWERAHHPPREFFSGNRAFTWSKIVNRYIVATTDELRAAKHTAWIMRHEIPARVIIIKPLWS